MRPDRLYLLDIVEAATSIQRFLSGMTQEAFRVNDLVQSAVLQKLIVLGEAASRLSSTLTGYRIRLHEGRLRPPRSFRLVPRPQDDVVRTDSGGSLFLRLGGGAPLPDGGRGWERGRG
jgi:hypothetical protein